MTISVLFCSCECVLNLVRDETFCLYKLTFVSDLSFARAHTFAKKNFPHTYTINLIYYYSSCYNRVSCRNLKNTFRGNISHYFVLHSYLRGRTRDEKMIAHHITCSYKKCTSRDIMAANEIIVRFRCTFWALNILIRCKSCSCTTDTKFMISSRYVYA